MTTRQEAVASLYRIYEARGEKRQAEAADKVLSDDVKTYMLATGEQELYDGESEIVATLQARMLASTLDLVRLAEVEPEIVLAMARAGALRADIKALDGRADFASAIDYIIDGAPSYALIVKEAHRA